MRGIIIILSVFMLSSCLKEEIAIPKKDLGDLALAEVNIGGNYQYQAYFDFNTGEIARKHNRDIWDIAFSSDASSNYIIINGAKNMFVYPTNKTDLSDVVSKAGYLSDQRFDSPYGELDSLAMRGWEDGLVRLIDLGYNSNNQQQGWYKIKILNATSTAYTFEFAKLEATTSTTVTIEKASGHNFVYYSLLSNSEQEVEPKKNEWDILFTQFTQRLYQPLVMPYLVTGAILNRSNTTAKRIDNVDFESIDLEYALSLDFTDTLNVIGYDWKEFDFDTETYSIFNNVSYLIRNRDGRYFKVKFVDFYGPTGETGNFKFEYQQIG